GEVRLQSDAEQAELLADLGAVGVANVLIRHPLLPLHGHVLALVAADRAHGRRLVRLGELRAARLAEERRHRPLTTSSPAARRSRHEAYGGTCRRAAHARARSRTP